MTRVDFYLLPPGSGARERSVFACRLAEKAWQHGHRVWLHAASRDDATELDNLLWTFRQGSFVPHALAGTEDTPILIGHGEMTEEALDLAIHLGDGPAEYARHCERLAEIVAADDVARETARAHFRHYRAQGATLHTHEIRSDTD